MLRRSLERSLPGDGLGANAALLARVRYRNLEKDAHLISL